MGSRACLEAVGPFLEEAGKAAHLVASYLEEAYLEGREGGGLGGVGS